MMNPSMRQDRINDGMNVVSNSDPSGKYLLGKFAMKMQRNKFHELSMIREVYTEFLKSIKQ
jgi:hypothetical protein